MSDYEIKRPLPQPVEDARALQARLYREIGISAVAAALQMRDAPVEEYKPRSIEDIPAILRGHDLAA
ncbi:MAG: hypothetical protein JWL62_64 [Hyphomicrobiales bacterium]|nr:hypothetical protein [Hyphomicrobiales bacterium]